MAAAGLLAVALAGCQQLREASGATVPEAVVKRHIWLAEPAYNIAQITFTAYDVAGIVRENARRKAADGGLARLITVGLSDADRANGAVDVYYVQWKGLRTSPDGGATDVGGEMAFTKTASGAWLSDQGIFDDAGHFLHTATSASAYAGSGTDDRCTLSITGDGTGTYRCTSRYAAAEGTILAFARFDLDGGLAALYDGPRVVVVGTNARGGVVKAFAEWDRGLRLKVDAYGGLGSGTLMPFAIGDRKVAPVVETAVVVEPARVEEAEEPDDTVPRGRATLSATDSAEHRIHERILPRETRASATPSSTPATDLPVYNPLSFVQADALLARGQALHILNGRTRVGLMVGVAQRTRTAVFRLADKEYVQHNTYSYPFDAESCATHRDEYLRALEPTVHVD